MPSARCLQKGDPLPPSPVSGQHTKAEQCPRGQAWSSSTNRVGASLGGWGGRGRACLLGQSRHDSPGLHFCFVITGAWPAAPNTLAPVLPACRLAGRERGPSSGKAFITRAAASSGVLACSSGAESSSAPMDHHPASRIKSFVSQNETAALAGNLPLPTFKTPLPCRRPVKGQFRCHHGLRDGSGSLGTLGVLQGAVT